MSDWKQRAIELAHAGKSWRKIAKELGVPKSSMSDFLRRQFKQNPKQQGPKILFIDVETSPTIAHVWKLWDNNVGLNQIEKEWHLLSFCAKWKGDSNIIYSDQRNAQDLEDDYPLIEEIWHLLNEADWVVGHNLKKFDNKKIASRFLLHGLPKPSPYKMVDTLEIAKKNFGFLSNKLEYLTDKLCQNKKLSHSKYPGHTLWVECMRGNIDAYEEMKAYNIMDVVSLEELYDVLSSWCNDLPNEDVYVDDILDMGVWEKYGYHTTQLGKYQVYRNKITGQQKRSRVNLLPKEKRESLLVNVR